MENVLAIIPARAGSKRVPNKNIRAFLGRPLMLWTIEFARQCPFFRKVVVSTDSTEIANVARGAGIEVPWLRPDSLATDDARTVDVVKHAIYETQSTECCDFRWIAVLQPTSPVRLIQTWTSALTKIKAEVKATIGIKPVETHPFWTYSMNEYGVLTPFFRDGKAIPAQNLPLAWSPSGSLYMCEISALEKYATLTPPDTVGIVCSEIESIDIDTERDWFNAERTVAAYREATQ